MFKKERIHLIVFSLTTTTQRLASIIKLIKDDNIPIFCLSPHVPFDTEMAKIKKEASKKIFFISFYEFISQEEMEYCDVEADKIILREYKTREGKLKKYYNKIKQLKNEIILKNISLKYELDSKFILAYDLGIDEEIWIRNNFKRKSRFLDPGREKLIKIGNKLFNLYKKLKKVTKICLMKTKNKTYYFFGRTDRVLQYLDKNKYEFVKIPFWELAYLYLAVRLSYLSRIDSKIKYLFKVILKVSLFIFKIIKKNSIYDIISPIHEDTDAYGYLAHMLDKEMFYLQDGLLPSYYPSAYLKYRVWVNKYFIWNILSKGIFERHSSAYEIWDCYKSMRLPNIDKSIFAVKKIVFLTSGAGDWTALKNRSDEDLSFMAFVEAAKNNPGIQFVFRPHPLWMHPEHQGVHSIQRLIDYAKTVNLPNLIVSNGALQEGRNFTKNNLLSVTPTTINDDINSSDIVLGDHSQALITAAQRGKIIASVSLAKRKEFFCDYTGLGFPILRSADDITILIRKIKEDPSFIIDYNGAIERHNNLIAGN